MLRVLNDYYLRATIGAQEIQLVVDEDSLQAVLRVLQRNHAQRVEYALHDNHQPTMPFVGTYVSTVLGGGT